MWRTALKVVDWFEVQRGRAVGAGILLFAGAVLYIWGLVAVRWLGPWYSLFILLAMVPIYYGASGIRLHRHELNQRQEERERRYQEMFALISGLKGYRRQKDAKRSPMYPMHFYENGKLRLYIEGLRLVDGTMIRCQVRHPSGRIRAADVMVNETLMSMIDKPSFAASAEYPEDFGRLAPPITSGTWQVSWRSVDGWERQPIVHDFDLEIGIDSVLRWGAPQSSGGSGVGSSKE